MPAVSAGALIVAAVITFVTLLVAIEQVCIASPKHSRMKFRLAICIALVFEISVTITQYSLIYYS